MADKSPGVVDPDVALRRKRKWDRITLILILVLLAIFGTGLIFLKHVRANFWTWRLTWKPDTETRGRLIASIVSLGDDAATGPALRLTHNDQPDARLAGQEILVQLIDQKQQDRFKRLQERINQKQRDRAGGQDQTARDEDLDKILEELRQPVKIDPAVAQRFREMLDDSSPPVQAGAVRAMRTIRDPAAAGRLASLAIEATDTELATMAVDAIALVAPGQAAEGLVQRVIAGAADPSAKSHAIELLGEAGEDETWAFRTPATIAALAGALDDDRVVTDRPRSLRFEMQEVLAQHGLLPPRPRATTAPASQPTLGTPHAPPASEPDESGPAVTVADYAARMLGAMLDKPLGLPSKVAPEKRQTLIDAYRQAAKNWTPKKIEN